MKVTGLRRLFLRLVFALLLIIAITLGVFISIVFGVLVHQETHLLYCCFAVVWLFTTIIGVTIGTLTLLEKLYKKLYVGNFYSGLRNVIYNIRLTNHLYKIFKDFKKCFKDEQLIVAFMNYDVILEVSEHLKTNDDFINWDKAVWKEFINSFPDESIYSSTIGTYINDDLKYDVTVIFKTL